MNKPYFYYNDTWRQGYLFFIAWKFDAMIKYLNKKYKLPLQDFPEHADGMTNLVVDNQGNRMIIVWVSPSKKTDHMVSLAHECLHATNMTCYNQGYELQLPNDEAHAYLFSIIFEKALESLDVRPKR